MRRYGIVKGQRSIEQTTFDLTSIGHFAKRRRVYCGRHIGVNRFNCGQDRHFGLSDAHDLRKQNRVLDDVSFFLQSRRNIERGIGDVERLGVHRYFKAKHMRHAPPCA